MTDVAHEHRIVGREILNFRTGSELACACGWWGHANRWSDLDHKARGGEVPPLPTPPPAPKRSRRELHAAIYGDRHRCAKCWMSGDE